MSVDGPARYAFSGEIRGAGVPSRMRRVRHVHTRVRSVVLAALMSCLLMIAPSARAQTVSKAALRQQDAPAGAVRVLVMTDENDLQLTVASPGERRAIISCFRECWFWGVRGEYRLWATSPARGIRFKQTLNVEQRSAFRVSSGSRAMRTGGLIVGIAGPLLMVSGLALGLNNVFEHQCNESKCPNTDGSLYGLMFFGGLAATPIGWVLFAASGPRVDKAMPFGPPRDPHLRVAVVALPTAGWGVGLSGSF